MPQQTNTFCTTMTFFLTLNSFTTGFDKLLLSSACTCRSIPFSEQSLVSITQRDSVASNDFKFVGVHNVRGIFSYERNPAGQIYLNNDDLKESIHGTIPTNHYSLYRQHKYSDANDTTFLHVPRTHNFVSSDHRCCVLNADAKYTCRDNTYHPHENKNKLIRDCELYITAMFKHGLANNFSFNEKKRASVINNTTTSHGHHINPADVTVSSSSSVSTSSTSTSASFHQKKMRNKRARKSKKANITQSKIRKSDQPVHHPDVLPTISLGWTATDCHQYSKNKCTTAGNIKPFLRDGGLSSSSKKLLLNCIQEVLGSLPSEHCFNVEAEPNETAKRLRKEMIGQFQELLGGSSEYDDSFRVEGITITVPSTIGFHRDKMNSDSEGMKSVVSINVNVPINDETVPRESTLRKWLTENGFVGTFPLSIILYSRKVVHHYIKRQTTSTSLASDNDINRLAHWMLTERVGSEIDYQSSVWGNDDFAEQFLEQAESDDAKTFKGMCTRSTETLDKMVSLNET